MNYNYSEWTDLELWKEVKENSNKDAFTQIHNRFARPLYSLAFRKTANATVAEDLVQDLFVTLWMNRDRISINKEVNIYLFGALKNRIISHLKKVIGTNEQSINDINPDLLHSYSNNSVEESFNVKEIQTQLDFQLKHLPEKSRVVFELSRSGMTNREIAELLGIVEKTVEFHISKCLKILKSNLIYIIILMTNIN